MSSNAEGTQPAPETPENAPKPPPDSSWLKTEEVRGTGGEQPPIPLEPRRRRKSSDAGQAE